MIIRSRATAFVLCAGLALLHAQTALSTLRGIVTDESGALVPQSTVRLTISGRPDQFATTNAEGAYTFANVEPGSYSVSAVAPGLALAKPVRLALKPGPQTLNLQLKVAALSEKVTVNDASGAASVSVEASSNASALVLRGDDLDALSDDPTSLAEDLAALAGPAAGPNGGAIYIDGFSGGELPSKASIREIRINQNPFSPEYDKLGFGRIEIFTKPGSDKFRGTAFYNLGTDWWNSRNPYAAVKAPFLLREYGGNVGGPINKKASFFADVRRDATDNGAIINGVNLDPSTLLPSPFTGFYNVLQRSIRFSGRLDVQLNANNTFTARYAFTDMDIPGAGIGSFNIADRGFDAATRNHTLQLSETTVLGTSAVNEVRFQYFQSSVHDDPFLPGVPALQVSGSFNGGGSTTGHASDAKSSYELQEYVSMTRSAHTMRFGIRLRGALDDSYAPSNFNGTFTFSGGTGPALDAGNQPIAGSLINISSIEQYRRTLLFRGFGLSPAAIRLRGGGASQFTLAAGTASLTAGQFDLGAFFGDDWRVRPNLTLSLGARYEAQTNISDARAFAPRLGLAWAPKGGRNNPKPKTVLRGGVGMFYDRLPLSSTIAAERANGILEQQYIIANPDFYLAVPAPAQLGSSSTQSVQKISNSLRAPYLIQTALGVERQLPANTTVAITYAASHGLHQFRSRNINAPVPGTGLFPYGATGPIFLIESAGLYNQNQIIANVNTKVNKNVSLNGSYMWNKAMSNTDGLGTFPANQYSMAGEYGPASTDVRQRATLAGSLTTWWNVRLNPLFVVQSGPPFDITSGQDYFGTSLFNSRPALAADAVKPGVIQTAYGLLDPNPTLGETLLTRNYGRGPGLVRMNLRISKTFGLGRSREGAPVQPTAPGAQPQGLGGQNRGNAGVFSQGPAQASTAATIARRFNLILSMQIMNLLNHDNPGPIIGSITSPLFGRANQPAGARDLGGGGFSESANNRQLELQIRLNF